MDVGSIHHVTAIAGSAQRNLDFYSGFLGLRLVKKTVNFDDPYTYHFYYGDGLGRPGTLLTFFPWEGVQRGQRGAGQVATVSLSIQPHSFGYWLGQLAARNLEFERGERFGEPFLAFEDPDGLSLELVTHAQADKFCPWENGPIDAEHAIRGLYGVTLWEDEISETEALLTGRLGYRTLGEENGTSRYVHSGGELGARVDIRRTQGFWPGVSGAGTIHHVAFRVEDDAAQQRLREQLGEDGLNPTPVIDRQYFRSVYFRELGGVLFEIATDPPGFAIDESSEGLGTGLKLPPQYETMREVLEASLPRLQPPDNGIVAPFVEPDLGFVHQWLPKKDATITLLTLHGTGGNEHDLVPLGRMLDPNASVLSPRGGVLEEGMPRFFKRLSAGVFDEEDLKRQANALAAFVKKAAETYLFNPARVIVVGYSNGANIATAVMLLHPEVLSGAVLFRPMVPFEPDRLPDLSGVPVFLSAGQRDRWCPQKT
jgi:predicted esterase/catechol 2,3-dioxygenase-like lactoylglutathione lyase family enzyme